MPPSRWSWRCGGSPTAPACRPPALLPIIGIGYALLPGPNVTLEPDIILTLVLPPLLYSAALDSSLTAIRRNPRTVVSAQREELLRWRDAGRLPDEGLRVLERELDHEERLLPDRPPRQ